MYWVAYNKDRSQIHWGSMKSSVYDQPGFSVEYYHNEDKLKQRIKELE